MSTANSAFGQGIIPEDENKTAILPTSEVMEDDDDEDDTDLDDDCDDDCDDDDDDDTADVSANDPGHTVVS